MVFNRVIHRFGALIRKLPIAAGVAAHEPGVTAARAALNARAISSVLGRKWAGSGKYVR
jgi:hypothetical protein